MTTADAQDYAAAGGPWDGPSLAELPLPRTFADGRWISSAEMSERADQLAAGLVERGVVPGDTVAFQLPPSGEAMLVFAACWRIAAVAAPVHHRFAAAETQSLLQRLKPSVTIYPGQLDQLMSRRADPSGIRVDGEAVAVALTTSGTSGVPKVVHHSHRALAYKARVMASTHGLEDVDVALMPAPTAHMSGLLNGVLVPGQAGMGVAFMSRWSPAEALGIMRAAKVSFMVGPSTYFVQMMRDPAFSSAAAASLRIVSCGGAGVLPEFCERASRALGAWVKRTYGSTEAPTVTTAPAGAPESDGWRFDGSPVGLVEIRIESGTDEILVRGPELFVGYDDPAVTAAAVDADGWYHTGDRGLLDGGRLVVIGRLRDLIIRGGENIDPQEVEAVCLSYPGVDMAVVVGVPDDVMGERVGAALLTRASVSLADLRAHCEKQGLARFKQPEHVAVADELPVRTFGKVDRAAVVRMLAHGTFS